MPAWEELFRQEEHRLEDPHHTVVTFAEDLRESTAPSRFLIWDAGQAVTLSIWLVWDFR